MPILEPGTLCDIVGGSRENAGRIVRIIRYIGTYSWNSAIVEGYRIATASGRPFASVRQCTKDGIYFLVRNVFNECDADRRNLRSLVDPKVEAEERAQKQADKVRKDRYLDAHLVAVQA